MRMSANHLFRYRLNDILESKRMCLFRHGRMENDMKQNIAKFLLHLLKIVLIYGFDEFIRFF